MVVVLVVLGGLVKQRLVSTNHNQPYPAFATAIEHIFTCLWVFFCVCVSQYYNRVTQCGYPGFPQLEPIYQYWLTCFPPHPNRHQTMMLYTPAHYTVYISLQSLSRWLTEDFSVRAISHFSCLLWGNGGNPAQPSSLNRELLYHCNILHTTTSKSSWSRLYRIWE